MPSEHDAFSKTLSLAVHELRTPVTVVSGYLRMLLREQGGPINEKQRKMLEEAERSCGRISGVVTEMSDVGKLNADELKLTEQRFDLAALVAELASGMHEGDDRGVSLEVRGCERPLTVTADRARVGAAVRTLLHCGLRERGLPGVIVAECSRLPGPPLSAVLAVGDEPTVRALMAAAGDRHARLDEYRGGLGLMMPLARRVVERCGGAMWSVPHPEKDLNRPGWSAGSALRIPLTE
jgi:light-regulated signal transduction histidine kinase (bacteriophytochrome)